MLHHGARMLVYFITYLVSWLCISALERQLFEVSGHCFLLVFSILTITEEAAVFSEWGKLMEAVRKNDENIQMKLGSLLGEFRRVLQAWTPLAQFWFFTMSFLQVVFNIMLLSTSMYFHQLPEKVAGVVAGLMCWAMCYIVMPNLGFVSRPCVLRAPFNFDYLKEFRPNASGMRSGRSGQRTPPSPSSSNPTRNLKTRL